MSRCRDGDQAAFRELASKYYQKLFMVALGIVNHPEDAREVVQEAFLTAYTRIRTFQGRSSFYTWIYRIAVNLSLDVRRSQKRNAPGNTEVSDAVESASADPSEEPYSDLLKKDLREEILRAIGELGPEHRAVLVLRVLEGLSYKEISRVLGCPEGTVMSRLHYARKQLQEKLRPWV